MQSKFPLFQTSGQTECVDNISHLRPKLPRLHFDVEGGELVCIRCIMYNSGNTRRLELEIRLRCCPAIYESKYRNGSIVGFSTLHSEEAGYKHAHSILLGFLIGRDLETVLSTRAKSDIFKYITLKGNKAIEHYHYALPVRPRKRLLSMKLKHVIVFLILGVSPTREKGDTLHHHSLQKPCLESGKLRHGSDRKIRNQRQSAISYYQSQWACLPRQLVMPLGDHRQEMRKLD